ncbi:N-acetylglucosamine-6-phosphate deacetylase [Virgibacillus sp. DJP39]|uniref:N-acetylglucosamine-6-phosphate deacetylase n=1 Tax=Virgibacillus sp. DJP39 TaxID=3409790 RepID=UPI003BB7B2FC
MTKDTAVVIRNVKIYMENKIVENGCLIAVNNKIQSVYSEQDNAADFPRDALVIDGTGKSLIPGFIDGHIHGANGADVMDGSKVALDAIGQVLPQEGTTSYLATTITRPKSEIERAIENVANYRNKTGCAEIIGIHLEGPFIEKSKAGAQPIDHILEPDIELFRKWQKTAKSIIKTVTLAPEHDPNGTFINYLAQSGVNVSAGHTKSGFSEMKTAVEFGVKQVTHICNAMTGIHHRDIGVVGAAFQLPDLRAELIADEIHVSKEMLQLIYDTMGSERLILITDAMRAKCLEAGRYELGGQPVTVSNGRVLLDNGVLAGSILKMRDGVNNMLNFPGVTLRDVIQMASVNPAKQIGVFDKKGSIEIGKDADFLLVDEGLTIYYTICLGIVAYKGEKTQ